CPDQAQPAHVRFTVLRPLDLLAAAPRQQLFTDVVLDSGNGDARPLAQVRDPHVFPLFLITPRGRQPILDSAVSSRLSPEVPMSGIASLYGSLRVHRPLLIATLLSLGVTLAAVVGLFVDGRELVGAPIWMKAFKFGVSIAIYTVTIAWMLALLPSGSRRVWWIGTIIAFFITVENVLIVLQIVRG